MPSTHTLFFTSENKYVLRLFLIKTQPIISQLGFWSTSTRLPINLKRITVLSSTHVNKKSKEQFESCKFRHGISIVVPVYGKSLFKQFLKNLKLEQPFEINSSHKNLGRST